MRYKDACEIAKEVLREITKSEGAVCYNIEDKEWLETAIKALELVETHSNHKRECSGYTDEDDGR